MDHWRYLSGVVTVELTSADIFGTLSRIRSAGFALLNLETVDMLTIRFQIRRREYKQLRMLCEKRGEGLRVLSKKGIFWMLPRLKQRPILVLGLALLLLFSIWVPGRIFFIRVEGNSATATRQILETASKCGIAFGAARREVRSEKMKNALLEAMPSLSWAGVNTSGCTAVITVRERDSHSSDADTTSVSSIVADRDGIIRQMTVLRGNGLCAVGQAVKAGDILISGYTDCGISIQAEAAKGEIFAETNRCLTAVCPADYLQRGKKTAVKRKFSLIIGKKRINFTNSSGISGTGCAKIYEENYMILPGGFVLPVAIVIETWTFYEEEQASPDLQQELTDFARSYLSAQMRGGTILLADEAMETRSGVLCLHGSYTCYEMIGITRIEENIPNYGKND